MTKKKEEKQRLEIDPQKIQILEISDVDFKLILWKPMTRWTTLATNATVTETAQGRQTDHWSKGECPEKAVPT